MKSKYRRGIDMVDKKSRYVNLGLLLLTAAALVLIPAASATLQYDSALKNVYGSGSCGTCHVNTSGGGEKTAYGTLFANETSHASDPNGALQTIERPPDAQNATAPSSPDVTTSEPIVTTTSTSATPEQTVTTTSTPDVAAQTGGLTETPAEITETPAEITETPAEITETPAEITETPAETVAQPIITIPRQTETVSDVASAPTPTPVNKAPGIGIVVAIGIIGIIYLIRRRK